MAVAISDSVTVSIGLEIIGNLNFNLSNASSELEISTSLLLLISEYLGTNKTSSKQSASFIITLHVFLSVRSNLLPYSNILDNKALLFLSRF